MGILRRHNEPAGTRYQMREKLFAIGDDFWVETDDGQRAFKVDGKALRVRSTFILESASGEELFKIQERDGQKIAEISKRWFRVRDTYGIAVAPGEDDALIVAAAVCIDEMAGD